MRPAAALLFLASLAAAGATAEETPTAPPVLVAVVIDDLGNDLRYAVRQIRRSPGFAALAVMCLSLGIGASSEGSEQRYVLCTT